MLKKTFAVIISALLICSMAACGSQSSTQNSSSAAQSNTSSATVEGSAGNTSQTASDGTSQASSAASGTSASIKGVIDTSDLFSTRDLEQTADTSNAQPITASDGQTVTVSEEGVYVVTGTAANFTVKIEAGKDAKVQLVLDGLNVTNDSTPVIYIVSADKCFITTAGSESSLSVTGSFTSDGDTSTDAVIFSKDDLVFNGTGTLNISSAQGNGIACKNDLKITGGTYNITSALDSIEAKDSISIYDGSIVINSSKDGLHAEDSEDDTTGYIYIKGGSLKITAADDAITAITAVQIDGGNLDLNAKEGIEGTYIQINGGTINIYGSDDGINGAQKSKSYGTPTIEINDGDLTLAVGQGDTDAIDSNGDIIVNGGTINITATMSSFDYDGTATYNGGTIIINGEQVDSIPQSMMGGGGGRGNMGGRGF